MDTGALYLSFWDICLDNLPEGVFVRKRIGVDEARQCIERARAENKLVCLCQDDLLAPYHEKDRKNHDALRKVLAEHFDISLLLADFLCGHEDDAGEGPLYTVKPLNAARVRAEYRLLIVTCAYGLSDKKPREPLAFEIIPSTVKFIMIEAIDGHPSVSDAVDHEQLVGPSRRARPSK